MVAIRAPAGWALNTGAVWVTIAVLDTGVDLSHPDLFVRILPSRDFVNNDNDPQDDNGHGTHVAAIAAASTNNGAGVAGNMAGQLFLRSYERSDRVYNAMLARGYTGHLNTINPHEMGRVDYLTTALALFVILLFQLVGRL